MVSAYFHQSLKSLDSRRERVYNHNSFTIKELNVCNSSSQKSCLKNGAETGGLWAYEHISYPVVNVCLLKFLKLHYSDIYVLHFCIYIKL